MVEQLQEEFFHHDALGDSAVKAFVREGIQNALDARAESEKQVRVRIALMRNEMGRKYDVASRFFTPHFWEHAQAGGNGLLPDDLPAKGDTCNYLVFEDFGTTGLTGDVEQCFLREKSNHFFQFFRAVGSTGKEEEKLGKWGVGKHTFWMLSRVRTVLGFTVREEGQPQFSLMGKVILKSHAVGDSPDMKYQDGYYGQKADDADFVLPLSEDDRDALALFKKTFNIQRETEPGLSVVVPWISTDIVEVKRDAVVAGVLEDYFYPILDGRLVVDVTVGGRDITINADNVGDIESSARVTHLIRLARLLQGAEPPVKIEPTPFTMPLWSHKMFAPDTLKELSESFRNKRDIALRVGVEVFPQQGHSIPSHFDIALARVDGDIAGGAGPCFVREGIIIPDVKSTTRGQKDIVALVVAERGELANFLGDCENPSHTEWQKSRVKSKKKYKYASSLLKFVCNSVENVAGFLVEADEEKDRTILADIFPMPGEEVSGQNDRKTGGTSTSGGNKGRTPQQLDVQQKKAGFSVGNNPKCILAAASVFEVRVAYHVRRGNPLARYHESDFLVEKLQIKPSGMKKINAKGNKILVETTSREFSLRVSGFDPNRDLYVRAEVVKEGNS